MTIFTKQGIRIAEINKEGYRELTMSWKEGNLNLKNGIKPLIHGVYKYLYWNEKGSCWDAISMEKQKHIALLQGESFKHKEYAIRWLSGEKNVKLLKEQDIRSMAK